jgi:ubiquinone/menaquinone biosynthesis C-methylase UbiE
MHEKKFDPKNLQKLNDPKRLKDIPPDFVWQRLDIEYAAVLVEIGAGTGFFSIAFLQHANPARVYACDVSETMIQWMQENVVPRHPRILPVKTGEHAVDLAAETADLVFMINLHHELDAPARTLSEAYRILRPGGSVCVVDWKKEEMPEGPPLAIRWTPEPVRDQLADAGFRHLKVSVELPKHFLVTGKKDSVP